MIVYFCMCHILLQGLSVHLYILSLPLQFNDWNQIKLESICILVLGRKNCSEDIGLKMKLEGK